MSDKPKQAKIDDETPITVDLASLYAKIDKLENELGYLRSRNMVLEARLSALVSMIHPNCALPKITEY